MEYRSRLSVLADAVTLTGSYVASSSILTASHDHHTLYVTYTPATDSTNAINVQVQASPDDENTTDANSNWHTIGDYTNAAGTLSEEAYTISDDSAGTAAQNLVPLVFEVQAKKIRIRYLETNSPASFGTITATLLSRSA